MRSVLSISLPDEATKERLQSMAKASGMNLSAFVLKALESEEKRMAWEEEMMNMSQKARHEYEQGESKELSSLEDLMLNNED